MTTDHDHAQALRRMIDTRPPGPNCSKREAAIWVCANEWGGIPAAIGRAIELLERDPR